MRSARLRRWILAFAFGPAIFLPAFAADRSWTKIRYQGGTVDAKVNPFDWNTTVTLTGAGIEIIFVGVKTVRIMPKGVLSLTHGEKAYRRVSDLLTVNPTSRPIPLFGMLRTGKDHLVGIQFENADGTQGAVLLLINKDSYTECLQALSAASGKPVED